MKMNHFRPGILRSWRQKTLEFWRDHQWNVIGGLWLITLALGYAAFAKHTWGDGAVRSPLDRLYLSLQLFVLESGSVAGPKTWELEVARLLAPGVAAFTALQALALVYYEQWQLLKVRFVSGHVVICGLGRKGLLLATGFLEQGRRVVVIEQDDENGLIESARERGATVLTGDARNRGLLRRARVDRAGCLVCVCGDDGANAEAAIHAKALVAGRRGRPLSCFVHIVDPQLCDLLKERGLSAGVYENFRLEFFNVFKKGARAWLDEFPIEGAAADHSAGARLIIVGLGRLGQSLLIQAADRRRMQNKGRNHKLRVTVVDRRAGDKVESLRLLYPELDALCDLNAKEIDIDGPEFQRADFLFDEAGRSDALAINICLDNDSSGLKAALALYRRVRTENIPVIVRMTHDSGLATLIEPDQASAGAFANLHAFGLLDRVCRPELLLCGLNETLAQAIHEDYLRRQRARGETVKENPSLIPWERLPENLKESNRRQADHIPAKLKAVDCRLDTITDWGAGPLELTLEEIELLAQIEHERFVKERLGDSWTLSAGPKDLKAKTNPTLVAWESLSETEREKDREIARRLPWTLALAGFGISRLVGEADVARGKKRVEYVPN